MKLHANTQMQHQTPSFSNDLFSRKNGPVEVLRGQHNADIESFLHSPVPVPTGSPVKQSDNIFAFQEYQYMGDKQDDTQLDCPRNVGVVQKILRQVLAEKNGLDCKGREVALTISDCLSLAQPGKIDFLAAFNSQKVRTNQQQYELLMKAQEKLTYVIQTFSQQPELEHTQLTFTLGDIVHQCVHLALIDLKIEQKQIAEIQNKF